MGEGGGIYFSIRYVGRSDGSREGTVWVKGELKGETCVSHFIGWSRPRWEPFFNIQV